jgi:hypothetical protein
MYTLPLRLTILHLAQRFRTDGETFMTKLLTSLLFLLHSQVFNYTRSCFFRLDYTNSKRITGQSGVEVLLR